MANETNERAEVQPTAEAGGSTAPGAAEGDRRSRYEEVVRDLKNSNKSMADQLAEMREQMAFLKGTMQAQQHPQKGPTWSEIDDPEERRDAGLAEAHGKITQLERKLAEREAEAAHNALVDRSLRGLNFGDEQGVEDAREMVDAFARKGKRPDEVQAFAQRLAARFNPQRSESNDKTPEAPAPDAKTQEEQEWAKKKLADAQRTRQVPTGIATASRTEAPRAPQPRRSAADALKDARLSLHADFEASRQG